MLQFSLGECRSLDKGGISLYGPWQSLSHTLVGTLCDGIKNSDMPVTTWGHRLHVLL